jgi:hypothetical protein
MLRRLLLALSLTFVPALAFADEIVRYQLAEWKAKHIHDAKAAETITKTLKKLGCELKQNRHNGHTDVRYRCVKWKDLKLSSHEEAHKWEHWLKEYQFKTEHKH